MAFYYEKLNPDTIDQLTSNAGRIGHIIRNLCQGFVNVNFPEILTLDNIAGQVEGQCRQLRSALRLSQDVKPTILACGKLAKFAKKILSEDFFHVQVFDEKRLDDARKWLDSLLKHFAKVDEIVNNAIVSVSEDLFKIEKNSSNFEGTPKENPGKNFSNFVEDDAEIEKEFVFEQNFDEKLVDAEKNLQEYKALLSSLGSFISNTSHWIQDEVSDFTTIAPYNEVANKVIALAGDIENQGRAIVADSANAKPNEGHITKYCDNSAKNVVAISDFVVGKDFPKERIERVLAHAKVIQEKIVVSVKKVISKGYKFKI